LDKESTTRKLTSECGWFTDIYGVRAVGEINGDLTWSSVNGIPIAIRIKESRDTRIIRAI